MVSRRRLLAGGTAGLAVDRSMALEHRGSGRRIVRGASYRSGVAQAAHPGTVSKILRQSGTERPFTSPLLHEERRGVFTCAGCDLDLFSSTTKFDSGTGWPSFWAPLDNAVGTVRDTSFFMVRTAVHCRRCGGHLGHVFDDWDRSRRGLRYCMNGAALSFRAAVSARTRYLERNGPSL